MRKRDMTYVIYMIKWYHYLYMQIASNKSFSMMQKIDNTKQFSFFLLIL